MIAGVSPNSERGMLISKALPWRVKRAPGEEQRAPLIR
jgi:hypothetical protein